MTTDPDNLQAPTGPLPAISGDRLTDLFAHQRHVIAKIADKQRENGLHMLPQYLWGNLDDRHTAMEISDNLGFCIEELVEARRELPARKPWKQNPEPADWVKFRDEMGDALAFFLEACIFAGITADELYDAFKGISAKNVARAEGTY